MDQQFQPSIVKELEGAETLDLILFAGCIYVQARPKK
jgi:hypothetical protein